jgi:hypothetical protein
MGLVFWVTIVFGQMGLVFWVTIVGDSLMAHIVVALTPSLPHQ